jgi:hypothetical protein
MISGSSTTMGRCERNAWPMDAQRRLALSKLLHSRLAPPSMSVPADIIEQVAITGAEAKVRNGQPHQAVAAPVMLNSLAQGCFSRCWGDAIREELGAVAQLARGSNAGRAVVCTSLPLHDGEHTATFNIEDGREMVVGIAPLSFVPTEWGPQSTGAGGWGYYLDCDAFVACPRSRAMMDNGNVASNAQSCAWVESSCKQLKLVLSISGGQGTLSLLADGTDFGTMASCMLGPFCWVAELKEGTSVRIRPHEHP